MVNVIVLVGRLTKDPKLQYTTNIGTPYASFTLAVDRNFTNQQGVREADFIPIVAWRKLAETCANNLTKGRLVAVVGRIQTRTWDDQDGKRHFITEVVADSVNFLDKKKEKAEETDEEILDGFVPVDESEIPF